MTTLHFAYGANMSRAVMQKYAPGAHALGVAELADHRFVITADGYASVEPRRADTVHGVLWRVTPPDRGVLRARGDGGGGPFPCGKLAVRGPRGGTPPPGFFFRARAGGRAEPR